jgi:hypothetical protein
VSPAGEPERLLTIYLNDHLAGAMLGVELARRLRSSNEDDPELGGPLAEICAEIEADRTTLEQTMERLRIRRGRAKPAAAWAAEKLGRLKLNGRLRGYSPLSRVLELESLHVGIAGKLRLWRVLERSAAADLEEFDFAELAERAASQRSRVERLHLLAAARCFPAPRAGTRQQ